MGILPHSAFRPFRRSVSLWQVEKEISTPVNVLWAMVVLRSLARSALTVFSATVARTVEPPRSVVDVGSISMDIVRYVVSRYVKRCPPTGTPFPSGAP